MTRVNYILATPWLAKAIIPRSNDMAEQQDDLRGFLMRDEKRTNDRAPEFTGKCMILGKEWRVAAWVKESKGGKKYFSLSFDEPRQQEKPAYTPPPNNDSDVPF